MIAFTPIEDLSSVLSIVSQIAIFGGATEAQQQKIFSALEVGVAREGECVFEKGDEPSHIYIVKTGNIELLIPDNDVFIEKKKLGVGECFGQVALLSMHKHTITAIATEQSEIIVLSRRALHRLRHEDIELFALLILNIARELARRVKFTDDMLLETLRIQERLTPSLWGGP